MRIKKISLMLAGIFFASQAMAQSGEKKEKKKKVKVVEEVSKEELDSTSEEGDDEEEVIVVKKKKPTKEKKKKVIYVDENGEEINNESQEEVEEVVVKKSPKKAKEVIVSSEENSEELAQQAAPAKKEWKKSYISPSLMIGSASSSDGVSGSTVSLKAGYSFEMSAGKRLEPFVTIGSISWDLAGVGDYSYYGDANNNYEIKTEVSSNYVILGTYYIMDYGRFEWGGKAGLVNLTTDVTSSVSGKLGGTPYDDSVSESISGVGLAIGVSAGFKLSRVIRIDSEWDTFLVSGEGIGGVSTFKLGLSFMF